MKKNYDILIIGGGAAGLMAAIKAAETDCGLSIAVLEKMPSCGRKICLTGKGRCNITNTRAWNEFSEKIHPKPNLLRAAFHCFSNADTVSFFESHGLPVTETRGGRIFPESMKASDVANTLVHAAMNLGAEIIPSCEAKAIRITNACKEESGHEDKKFIVEAAHCGKACSFASRMLIIATGGLSYPSTGSTGDGYMFAKGFGHKITPLFPSLTALTPYGYKWDHPILTLKNIRASLYESSEMIQSETGDIDFTDGGIEGPVGFKLSRRAVKSITNGGKISVCIDLKPAVSEDELKSRIEREISDGKYRASTPVQSILRGFMPAAVIPLFLSANRNLALADIPHALKNWTFRIESFVGYRRAVVTAGGIDMGEIKQKDMSSKLEENLYFAGEVLDFDGDTGGYNLQIAFSTGALAGISAARQAKAPKQTP